MSWLWQRIQHQPAALAGAVVVITNLVVLSGTVHLSSTVLGELNASIAAFLAFLVTLVPLVQQSAVRRAYLKKARQTPKRLVWTAAGMVGEAFGRDELCRGLAEALRDRSTRCPHVVIGGVGSGKTALLVRLTRLLAEQELYPVPIGLRDAQESLDFAELAHRQFLAEAEAPLVSDLDVVDKVWRQLRAKDKIVVLADGLEEALIKSSAVVRARDSLILLSIEQASEHKLPLIITSRPHDLIRDVDAVIIGLKPLSDEAALEHAFGEIGQDDRNLGWVLETADVAESPLYLQIIRQLYVHGLMEAVTARRDGRQLDTRSIDQVELRLRLLETWIQALIGGYLAPEVARIRWSRPLAAGVVAWGSRSDREAVVEQLSLMACIGLRQDQLQVKFDDVEALRNEHGGLLFDRVDAMLEKLKCRFNLRVAADWGDKLGLVEAQTDSVRFPHIMQAYLGSRLIDAAMTDEDYRTEALQKSGREFLIAQTMSSRAGRRW
jgi:hypothetical protein